MFQGHTLIELLLVIGIIVILAGMTYPNYRHHLIKTHQHAAQIELVHIAGLLEDYYNLHHTYLNARLSDFAIRPNEDYDFALSHLSGQTYAIEAHAKTSTCTLQLNEQGRVQSTNCE